MSTQDQNTVQELTFNGKLYKESELAKILKVSCVTLKRIRYAKKISFLRIGMQVRYTEQHLQDYLRRCQRESKS